MIKNRIAESVFWLVWSRGVVQAISFVVTLAVARLLDPQDYGLMALAAVWTGILGIVVELGLGSALIQFRDLRKGELNFCFFLMNAIAWLTYGALFAAAPFIAAWFRSPDLAPVLRATGLMLPISALCSVHSALLTKRLQFDALGKADIFASVVGIPVVLVLAVLGYGVWALVAAALCRPVASALVIFWHERWVPGLAFQLERARAILRYSVASFGSRALWATYDQGDAFVLGKVSGETALGFYTMGRDLASLPVVKISSAVNQLAVPVMAELQDDRAGLRHALLRGVRLVSGMCFPACVGIALVAEDAVRLILTEKWLPSVPILQIICASALVKSVDVLLPPVLRARFRIGFLAGYNTVLLLVMPFLFLLGAVWAGGVGVALAWALGYPVVMCWMAREALREIDLGWNTLLAQLRTPVVAVVAMAGVVWCVQQLVPGNGIPATACRFTAAVAAGAAAYGAILWIWGGPLTRELREMLSWLLRPRGGSAAG